MANLTSSQIKDSYQSVLTTSETTSDPTTGTLQNGKGSAITTLTVSGTVNATTLGGTLSTASQPNVTSVGTLTSATITGDLTVDTSTLKVDSANNRVGIGTASPATTLHVSDAAATTATFNSTFGQMAISFANSGTTFAQLGSGVAVTATGGASDLGLGTNGQASANIVFATGAAFTERMRIDASGQVGIGLTPTSRNNTTLQIKDGIGFPATQVASTDPNTLDDYEEGTFDFGIAFGGSDTGVTYDFRAGRYTKVGRLVSVGGYLVLSSKGAEVGAVTITGLPFPISAGTAFLSSVSFGFIENITFADMMTGYGAPNTSTIDLFETTNAGANTQLTNADFANNSILQVSLTYFVA